MKLNPNEKNAFEALWQLIKFSNITVTATSLKNTLLQHQNATTLLGMSDVLNEFNIPNLATRLPIEQLQTIPLPAIAYFEANGGTFVTIKKIENDLVEWYHDTAGVFKEPIHNFIHKWHGITLLVEPNAQSGEVNYKEARKNEIIEKLRIPFVITGLLTVIGIILYPILQQIPIDSNFQFYALLLTKTLGIITSTMLVWYDFDANNSFLKSVCQINSKTNCSNILNSQASKFWGWLTWSEIGLFYFTGGFLALVSSNNFYETLMILKYLSILALPYTAWSVFYQAFIAKEWCVLCLTIQLLLWFDFFTLLQIHVTLNSEILNSVVKLLLCFLLVAILWVFIKKPLRNSVRFDEVYNSLQRIKFDPDFIKGIFSKERILPPLFEGMKVLKMGNPNAENTITLVLSPSCPSCGRTFEEIQKLIHRNNQFQSKVILFGSNILNSVSGEVTRSILNLDENKMEGAAQVWFKNIWQDQQKWKMDLGLDEDLEVDIQQMNFHLRWIALAGVTSAPAIFINSVELPSFFEVANIERLFCRK